MCFMLGNTVLGLLYEEFQEQVYEDSDLFFVSNKASVIDHLAPTYFLVYSVDLELHARSLFMQTYGRVD
jgi:hypothetical protein